METESIAKRFVSVTLLNAVLAVAFTAVILDPGLCVAVAPGQFGCKANMVTSWPGTWLFIAYFTFLIAGVLGTLGWAGIYSFSSRVLGKTQASRPLSWLHLIFFEVGVLGATATMAAIGYTGGGIIASGGGIAVAAEAVRLNIIPPLSSDPNSVLYNVPPVVEAVFIGMTLLGMLTGLLNRLRLK